MRRVPFRSRPLIDRRLSFSRTACFEYNERSRTSFALGKAVAVFNIIGQLGMARGFQTSPSSRAIWPPLQVTLPYANDRAIMAAAITPMIAMRLRGGAITPHADMRCALASTKSAWLTTMRTVSSRNGLAMRNAGSGASPVKSAAG
jgi:hypothetical protein